VMMGRFIYPEMKSFSSFDRLFVLLIAAEYLFTLKMICIL
jgi:hypothetical protein